MSSITGLFVGAHVLLAQAIKTPELAITMDEGGQFMKAAQNVARHYDVRTTQKAMDWIAFCGVGCMIYVPRVVAIANNRHKPAPAAPAHVINGQAGPIVVTPEAPPGSPLETAMSQNNVSMPEYEHN